MFDNEEAEVLTEGDMSDSQEGVSEPEVESTGEETAKEEKAETAPEGKRETPVLGDPNKLPPELQPYYKEMQASFTKKMQSLQAAVEAVTPHEQTVKLFQKAIAGDPAAREQIMRIAGHNPPVEQKKAEEELPEQFETTKQLMDYLTGHFEKMIQSRMESVQKPIEDMQIQNYQKAADLEIENCRKQYPDFDDRVQDILAIRQKYPGLDLEASYKLATYQQKAPVQQATMKPGTSPGKVVPKKKGPLTWEDSFAMAKAELGMK